MFTKVSFLNPNGDRINLTNLKINDKKEDDPGNFLSKKYFEERRSWMKRCIKELYGEVASGEILPNLLELEIVDHFNTEYTNVICKNNKISGDIVFLCLEDSDKVEINIKNAILNEFETNINIESCSENFELYLHTSGNINPGLLYCINESKIVLSKETYIKLTKISEDSQLFMELKDLCPFHIHNFLLNHFTSYKTRKEIINEIDSKTTDLLHSYSIKHIENILSIYPQKITDTFLISFEYIYNNTPPTSNLYSTSNNTTNLSTNKNTITISHNFHKNHIYTIKNIQLNT